MRLNRRLRRVRVPTFWNFLTSPYPYASGSSMAEGVTADFEGTYTGSFSSAGSGMRRGAASMFENSQPCKESSNFLSAFRPYS